MSFSVLITLTTAGQNTGPTFNLYSDADSYATAFATGITKTSLVNGYTSSAVPDGSTTIRCKSIGGACNNSIVDIAISGLPGVTPTPTPTATPTPTPIVQQFPITLSMQGYIGYNGSLKVYQAPDGASWQLAQTLNVTGNQYAETGFIGTPGYYYYLDVTRTGGGTTIKTNAYTVSANADLGIDSAACGNTEASTASSYIQLPVTVVQSTIVFGGTIEQGCR